MFPISAILLALALALEPDADALRTVAERSGYRATARYDDVVALGKRLAESSKLVHVGVLGKTVEGRPIPLWVVADPPVTAAPKGGAGEKLVVLLVGNIHGGEVCGKEALPMLRASSRREPGHPLLKDLVVAMVPIFNADGNERVAKDNRPGQVGPEEGMGERTNARGLDLNRDFMKLEAPETRALVRFLERVEPCARRRYPHHQWLVPPLHGHLRGAEEPRGRPPVDRLCAGVDAARGRPPVRSRDRPARVLLRQLRGRPQRVDDLPCAARASARRMSACATVSRCSPRPMPMPRSRPACWPRATSSAAVSSTPPRIGARSSVC